MPLSQRFDDALTYSARAHAGQVRKATAIPYVSHLLMVAGLAFEYGADEDEGIAALLHDAVEDSGGRERADDIRRRFGDRVADIVIACSDTDVTPKPPASERKRRYLEHLRGESNRSVLLVSACDKLANVRSVIKDYREMGDRVFDRFNIGKPETITHYGRLAEVFAERMPGPLAAELARSVAELRWLAGAEAPS